MNINNKLKDKYTNRITGKSPNGDVKFYIDYADTYSENENNEYYTDNFDVTTSEYFKYTAYNSEEQLIKNFKYLVKTVNFLKNNQPDSKLIKEIKNVMQEISDPNNMYRRLGVDIITILIGVDLINCADPELNNSTLLPQIAYLRKKLVDEYGYVIPNVRVVDSLSLQNNEYSIEIRGKVVLKESVDFNNMEIKQVNTQIINSLEKICFQYVQQIFTKFDTLKLIELAKADDPTLVNDLIPLLISAIDLKYIFTNLLSKKISIKDIIYIFELLNFHAQHTQDVEELSRLVENDLNF